MTDGFYRAFEDRHRGSREIIKARLTAYLPFIQGLQGLGREVHGLDLGCGRGEWLELLTEKGVNVQGVDLDEGMLQACLDRGLSVVREDALEFLRQQSEESFDIVSAFHFVEHIPFSSLQTLVKEALRVLRPAGLLIMETPNPDNVVVGASGFYMDPTHTQPIPAPLLAFLTEYLGYVRQKVLGLQEPESVRSGDHIGLRDVLFHVSPDYAVVAQVSASEEALAALDGAFETEYGRSLGELCQRFDQGLSESFETLRDKLDRAEDVQSDIAARIARTESLASEVATLRTEAGEHERRAEALQSEVDTAHTRTERLEAALTTVQSRVERLSSDLSERERELASEIATLQAEAGEYKGRAEALQSEVDTAHTRTERLEAALTTVQRRVEQSFNDLSERERELARTQIRIEQLSSDLSERERELETAQTQIEQLRSELADKNNAAASAQAALADQQAHSQWLQNEWDVAKAKIDELNESAHRWWQTADSLNTELQAVYRSNSWRVTWPLRKVMVLVKWLLRLPVRLVRATIHLPKAIIRWLVARAVTFVLRRDGLKRRALQWVNRHPRLKRWLQEFARRRHLYPNAQSVGEFTSAASEHSPTGESVGAESDDPLEDLNPRARAIYEELRVKLENKRRVHQ